MHHQMTRNHYRVTRNMGKQESISPPREKNNSSSSSDSTWKLMEMSDKEFRIFIVTKLTEMEVKRETINCRRGRRKEPMGSRK